LSESGVEPLPLRELLRDDASVEHFLNHPLAYSQGNGTPELRSSIAAMYRGATPEQVLVTNGSSEACLLALWHLVEPGDEVVLMLPNYMESWGLVQMFGGKVRPLWLREDRGWQFDPDELATLVGPRTKTLAVCNPNNPTRAVGPPATIETLWASHDYTSLTPTYLSDRLAQIALSPGRREEILARTRSILQRNYGMLREWIGVHGSMFTHIPPIAGAICFLRYSLRINSSDLAWRLLKEKSTLIVPGDQFGMDGYIRIGMGHAGTYLSEALGRVDETLRELAAE